MPVELIELAIPNSEDGGTSLAMFRLLRMVRLLRLLRLLKIEIYVRRLEERLEDELDSDLRLLRIVKLVIKLLFLSHFVGCAWMALASWGRERPHLDTWIAVYNEGDALDGAFTQQCAYADVESMASCPCLATAADVSIPASLQTSTHSITRCRCSSGTNR